MYIMNWPTYVECIYDVQSTVKGATAQMDFALVPLWLEPRICSPSSPFLPPFF